MRELSQHISTMLNTGRHIVENNPLLTKEIGTTNTKGDRTIEMDVKLESAFLDYLKVHNLPVWIYSEEIGMVREHPNPEFLAVFDPLDGSTNYKLGHGILSFGSLIAFYKGTNPQLQDVVAAGAIEYTTNRLFLFEEGRTVDEAGENVLLRQDWELDKNTPVYLETYGEGYEYYREIGNKLFVKNQGALVSSLLYLLNNASAAMGGIAVKSEEIGAIYALVKGAGGAVQDSKGEAIDELKVDHSRKYDILAGAPVIVSSLIDTLQKQ